MCPLTAQRTGVQPAQAEPAGEAQGAGVDVEAVDGVQPHHRPDDDGAPLRDLRGPFEVWIGSETSRDKPLSPTPCKELGKLLLLSQNLQK